MLAALEQAWCGRGNCAPNPSVGAIAVYNNQIIARACHSGVGMPHAEQLILQQIPKGLGNIILYVTLEPCNHWGRTPPCVAAIIEHGISQVIYGFHDPNPIVANNSTPLLLRQGGVDVMHFPLREIDQFYASYYHWMLYKTPWITAKIAQSLDGKIAKTRNYQYKLSNTDCNIFTHQQRSHADAIMTTATTIIIDNPKLNVRLHNTEKSKPLIILDNNLKLSKEFQALQYARYCHIYYNEGYSVKRQLPNCTYHAAPSINGLLDLNFIIKHLGALGYHDIWVEAGGILFSALHKENLVQRTYIYIIPKFLGENAIAAYHGINVSICPTQVSWHIKADNIIACLDWQKN